MAIREQVLVQNQTFMDMVDTGGAMKKRAEDDAGEYIRRMLREESFSEKILPPEDIGNDFDRALWTDKPIKIYDKESNLSQAVAIGYAANAINFYIQPNRFAVTPTMLLSPKVMKHKWELRTYKYDVRQVFADNMVKDLQAVKDDAFLATTNLLLVGAGSTMPFSNTIQYRQISGGFSRNSVVTACGQVLQATQFNIPVETNLVNNITWWEKNRWDRLEAGGDLSQEMLTKPYAEYRLFDQNWLVTIKRGLVANLTHYLFGPTKFLGKAVRFTPPRMIVKTEAIDMYMFQCAEEYGSTIAHTGAIGRVDYLAA